MGRFGRPDIRYTLTPTADLRQIAFEIRFRPKQDLSVLQMPSWSPGFYVQEDYWKTLTNVVATDEKGKPLKVTAHDDTWTVDTKQVREVRLTYSRVVDHSGQRLGMFSGDDTTIHYSGPTMYMYLVDRKEEPYSVTFNLPATWQIATSLHKDRDTFVAQNYDELVDCPVTLGRFIQEAYTVNGIPYIMAFRGPAVSTIDRKRAIDMARFITKAETQFFGGAPFEK
jgi:predicted metalloprotease with PDZ domain